MLCMQVTAWKKDFMSFYVFSTGINFPSIKKLTMAQLYNLVPKGLYDCYEQAG